MKELAKFKIDMLFWKGEPGLSFEYKFVGHPWKLLKLYPTVHAYLFFFTLYCIVSTENTEQVEWVRSAHGGSLRYEGIGRIQNWYVILKGENLGFHLNINLSATLDKLLKLYPTVHAYLFFLTLYCIVSTENTDKLKECEVHTEAL